MNEKLDKNKIFNLLKILLIVGSIFAAVKMILVDYTMDEEYHLVMTYRSLKGDTLFGTMWEPHQSSAFLCAWLMQLYVAVTGTTTGVVIFLRVCTTGIQCLISLWLCKTMESFVDKEYAFLLGLIYFNIIPKMIQIPEFSNMQVWACTVLILALLRYYKEDTGHVKFWSHGLWLCVAGLGMAISVLVYPSLLVLFPFCLIFICCQSGKNGKFRDGLRDSILFAMICGSCGVIWLCGVLSHITGEEFLRNVRYVIDSDLTHDLSTNADYRSEALFRDSKLLIFLILLIVGIAFVLWMGVSIRQKRRNSDAPKPGSAVFAVLMTVVAEAVQLWYWVVFRTGYEIPQLHLLVVLIASALLFKEIGSHKKIAAIGPCIAGLILLAVIYMSDLGLWYAIPHGLPGVPLALAVILWALRKQCGKQEKKWAYLLLFSLAFLAVFGKGFVLRAGVTETNTVLGIRGVIWEGPAAGIFTNYMQAYMTNSAYEEFEEYVEEGANCLIVTNMVGSAGTSPYLFRNCNICHFSIVDPTSYDERLEVYWELYPKKRPEVIVVDCWYGELKEASDSWMMRYIENDFGYTDVIDGKYVRYYIKDEKARGR